LLTNCELPKVLISKILVDVGFLGVEFVLEFKLGSEHLSVSISLGNEGGQFLDFILDSGQIDGYGCNGSLEFGMLGVQGINSLLMGNDILSFSGTQIIQGVNDGVSELIQLGDDFSEHFLVGEVLGSGQSDQSLDQGGVLAMGSDSGLNLPETVVEFFHLE
jgi:hypothetical protein